MADVPTNEKLYALVVSQAKARYRIYPSPGASHWVHRRYLELGGKFEDSAKIAERKRLVAKFIERRREMHGHDDHDARAHDVHDKKKKHGDK
jgi:hypothetical protein